MPGPSEILSDIPIFSDLTLDEMQSLDQYFSSMEVKAGEVIFKEDDDGDFVCFVLDGTLDVLKKNMSGELEIISHVYKGRAIGEMALIDKLKRSATVMASTDTSLTILTRQQFDEIQENLPHICNKILRNIARSLSLSLRRTSNKLSDSLEFSGIS